jgi:hypothetical protein
MRICGAVWILAAVALAAPAAASEDGLLAEGLRIRVRTERVGGWLEGRVVEVTGDSPQGRALRITARNGAVLTLPLASVSEIEISTGSRRRPLRGLLIGAGIGLVLGGIVWAEAASCGGCDNDACVGTALLTASAVSGAAYGAGVGALIKTPHGQPAALERPRVSIVPMGRRSLGLRLAWRF